MLHFIYVMFFCISLTCRGRTVVAICMTEMLIRRISMHMQHRNCDEADDGYKQTNGFTAAPLIS